ncbi:unnamed protein product [Closterium sp. NIES-53]
MILSQEGLDGEYYTLTFIDACTRYVWAINTDCRSLAFECFVAWMKRVERQSGLKLKTYQTDGGLEFFLTKFKELFKQKRVEHLVSLPYAHEQQGVAERTNQSLATRMRALMKQSAVPTKYCPFAMNHAVRPHNLLPSRSLKNNSPYRAWTGRKADTPHNYSNEARRSPDAELPPPNTSQDTLRLGNDGDDDVVEVTNFHDYDCLQYIKTNKTGLRILGLAIGVHHTSPKEPTTVRQALSGPDSEKWKAAMATEVAALKSRRTWKLVPRSSAKGRKILRGKWVFRIKTLAVGSIDKYKARWMVRRFEQTHMVDFDLTYAPVGRHTSVRILICIAAVKQRPLRQIDVSNAFLYAPVDAIIFVEQPHAFE